MSKPTQRNISLRCSKRLFNALEAFAEQKEVSRTAAVKLALLSYLKKPVIYNSLLILPLREAHEISLSLSLPTNIIDAITQVSTTENISISEFIRMAIYYATKDENSDSEILAFKKSDCVRTTSDLIEQMVKIRESLSLSPSNVDNLADLPNGTVNRLENKKLNRDPRIGQIIKILQVYGLTLKIAENIE